MTTPNFEKNGMLLHVFRRLRLNVSTGSGLTRKQRSLVIIVIVLLFYIAIGSLIQSYLLKLTFIDALYFTVTSIEAVGKTLPQITTPNN